LDVLARLQVLLQISLALRTLLAATATAFAAWWHGAGCRPGHGARCRPGHSALDSAEAALYVPHRLQSRTLIPNKRLALLLFRHPSVPLIAAMAVRCSRWGRSQIEAADAGGQPASGGRGRSHCQGPEAAAGVGGGIGAGPGAAVGEYSGRGCSGGVTSNGGVRRAEVPLWTRGTGCSNDGVAGWVDHARQDGPRCCLARGVAAGFALGGQTRHQTCTVRMCQQQWELVLLGLMVARWVTAAGRLLCQHALQNAHLCTGYVTCTWYAARQGSAWPAASLANLVAGAAGGCTREL